jgi:hypothetical protein
LIQVAFYLNRAAVELDQFLHERKPDARTLLSAGAAPVHAIKALEEVRQPFRGNAHPGIANRENDITGSGEW